MKSVVSTNRWAFVVLAVIAFALGIFASRANAANWMVDPVGGVPVTDPGDTALAPPDPELFVPLQEAHGGAWKCKQIGGAVLTSTMVAAGEAGPASALISVIAAGAWTRGCELGVSHNDPPTIIDGLPRHSSARSMYALHWVHWDNWKQKHAHWINHHPGWLKTQRTWFHHHNWNAVRPLHKRIWLV